MPQLSGSLVLAYPPDAPSRAAAHFREVLARTTDPSDVAADMERGVADYVVLDARSPEAFARGHVPGAVNLPHRAIGPETTSFFRKDRLIVTYCDGVHCNASTKAAFKLAELGFAVKEMSGGLDGWIRDGFAVETPAPPSAATGETAAPASGEPAICGC